MRCILMWRYHRLCPQIPFGPKLGIDLSVTEFRTQTLGSWADRDREASGPQRPPDRHFADPFYRWLYIGDVSHLRLAIVTLSDELRRSREGEGNLNRYSNDNWYEILFVVCGRARESGLMVPPRLMEWYAQLSREYWSVDA